MGKQIKVCAYSGCNETKKLQGHHVTYRPARIELLCDRHHRDITIININESETYGKLDNWRREILWSAWLNGKVQPRMTAAARRWMKNWGKPRSRRSKRRNQIRLDDGTGRWHWYNY